MSASAPMGYVLASPTGPNLDTQIRTAVDALMREYRVPGLAIAVSHNGQHTFYNFGVASQATQDPVSSDTLFKIGSISKTFTATLASYAQTSGRFSWTDSPARFLPELSGTDIAKVDLLSLATHTAGGFPLQLPDGIDTPEQLMTYYRAWSPEYPSGTARTYANPSIG